MQGAGNDFVVIDSVTSPVTLSKKQIQHIANRYFGVGCDQLLMVEKTRTPNVDFRYRIFNADGGEVEQCGNGARCFVRFVIEKGLTSEHNIKVETSSGMIKLALQDNGQVTVNMGAPHFAPDQIPFNVETEQQQYSLNVGNETLSISVVSMGNPHAVTLVEDVDNAEVAKIGPLIEAHALFPRRVNAGFMQVLSPHEIKLRVFERGSGETLSCGSGACAAVVSGIQIGILQSPVLVNTRGGQLNIVWSGSRLNEDGNAVMMTGPAEIVFEGQIDI